MQSTSCSKGGKGLGDRTSEATYIFTMGTYRCGGRKIERDKCTLIGNDEFHRGRRGMDEVRHRSGARQLTRGRTRVKLHIRREYRSQGLLDEGVKDGNKKRFK